MDASHNISSSSSNSSSGGGGGDSGIIMMMIIIFVRWRKCRMPYIIPIGKTRG
jgi:hypothetical protein